MLPAAARLRVAGEFGATVRGGHRGGSRTVVVHLRITDRPGTARAGFVVSKKVGNSVVRHRVTRRLRPIVRARLVDVPDGTDLVVRALPTAADASSAVLAHDVDKALDRALSSARATARRSTGS